MRSLRPRAIFAVAAAAAIALAIIAGSCSSSTPSTEPEEPAIAATVHITDGAFDPREVEIEPGGSIRWINDDVTVHRLTFLDPPLDSGNLGAGRSWVHTFATEGEFLYYDTYRNTMKGAVVVRPAP